MDWNQADVKVLTALTNLYLPTIWYLVERKEWRFRAKRAAQGFKAAGDTSID
jgi:hypothetical protein